MAKDGSSQRAVKESTGIKGVYKASKHFSTFLRKQKQQKKPDFYVKKPRNIKKWTLGDELSILNGEWITDSITITGQNLIQLPTGFQCPTLGFTLSYRFMNMEFVQIIHNGANHWVTISTVG
uniref:Uncharacterized protein n=1 Tax=Amphimedon queenslandica TaxID=400682 RepID=A0A1X7VJM5_AMPQE